MRIAGIYLIGCLIMMTELSASSPPVTIRVTHDFQNPPILEKKADAAGQSVMASLKQSARVETTYGGAFVTAIQGLQAKGDRYWLYYVNGMLAPRGATEYMLRPDDIAWWDMHSYGNALPVTSLAGSFPQPFLSFGKTGKILILTTDDLSEKGRELLASLSSVGICNLSQKPIREKRTAGTAMLILGSWAAIRDNPTVADIFRNRKKTGIFIRFEEQGIDILDIYGVSRMQLAKGGAILAATHGNAPVWIITGTDREEALRAADLIIGEPGKINGFVSAVATKDRVIPAPLPGPN